MPGEEITLKEEHRSKLDGIVADMEKNGEKPEDIQFVVDDFKSKYGVKKKLTPSPLPSPSESGTLELTTGASVPSGVDYLAGDVNSNIPSIPETKPLEIPQTQQPLMAATSPLETTAKDIINLDPNIAQKQEELNPKKEALGRGLATAGSIALKSPAGAYDAMATMLNSYSKVFGTGGQLPAFSQIGDENTSIYKAVVSDLDNAIKASSEEKQKVYPETVSKYFSDGNYGKGFELLGLDLLEMMPTSIALGVAIAENPAAANIVGTSGFLAENKKRLDENENTKNLTEDQKVMWSALMGGTEMITENLGVSRMPIFKDILKKSGKEGLEKAAKDFYAKTMGKALARNVGLQSEEVGTELLNNTLQNIYASASGEDPNRKPFDNSMDTFIHAAGLSGTFGAPQLLSDIVVTKSAKKEAQKLKEQKEALSQDLQNPEISDLVKQSLSNKLKDINEQEANLAAEENELMKDLDATQQAKISQLNQKSKEIEAAMSDELVSETSKKALQTDLENIDNEVQTVIKESKKNAEQMAAEEKARVEDDKAEIEFLTEVQSLGFATEEQTARLKELQGSVQEENKTAETGLVEGEQKSEPIDLGNEVTEVPVVKENVIDITGSKPEEIPADKKEYSREDYVREYYNEVKDNMIKSGNWNLGNNREMTVKASIKDLKAAKKNKPFDNALFEEGYKVQKEIKERRNVDAPLLAKSLGEALSETVKEYKSNQELLVALENKYFDENGLTRESFDKLDDTEKSKIIKDAVEWKKNNPNIVSEVKKSLTEETKTPKQKPKDELIDTEEEATIQENDKASIQKLDDDLELLKGFSKKDLAEKKFIGMIERAYKMKEEGKITRKKYTEYKNKAKDVLGGKYDTDIESTQSKLAVTSLLNKVKEKLLGQGYEKITLSSTAPISPKTVSDLIDLAGYIAHKAIDVGKGAVDVANAIKEAVRVVKLHPTYKRLTASGELNEKDFEKALKDSLAENKKEETESKKESMPEPDITGEKRKRGTARRAEEESSYKPIVDKMSDDAKFYDSIDAKKAKAYINETIDKIQADGQLENLAKDIVNGKNPFPVKIKNWAAAVVVERLRLMAEKDGNEMQKDIYYKMAADVSAIRNPDVTIAATQTGLEAEAAKILPNSKQGIKEYVQKAYEGIYDSRLTDKQKEEINTFAEGIEKLLETDEGQKAIKEAVEAELERLAAETEGKDWVDDMKAMRERLKINLEDC